MPSREPMASKASDRIALPRNAAKSTGAEKSQRPPTGGAVAVVGSSGDAERAVVLTESSMGERAVKSSGLQLADFDQDGESSG